MADPRPRLRPSEVLHAFAIAKENAAKRGSKIIGFINTEDHTSNVNSSVPIDCPLFEALPNEVWIEDYTPFHPHKTKLSFRNRDKVTRRLMLEPPASPFFKVLSHGSVNKVDGRVAAGMVLTFQLEFYPQEVDDYAVDIICCTERERFVLPVRARGKFAALDIPDEVTFDSCPVKTSVQKAFSVRNVGSKLGKFTFQPSAFFSIHPTSIQLPHGEATQLVMTFEPRTLDDENGEMIIVDDSGQECIVRLRGDVETVPIYLSHPLVESKRTYTSLTSRKTIRICNESEYALEYSWKAFAELRGEENERHRLLNELSHMEQLEMEQAQKEHADDNALMAIMKALETKYRYLRKAVAEDEMQFASDAFSISPMSGKIFPHAEVAVTVAFFPTTALRYSTSAFLDVGGQEMRLPLQIRGLGIGPKAKVIYNELLDFGDIFVSDSRTLDFTIQNKGEIPAQYELDRISLPEGTTIEVTPSSGTLFVSETQKIDLTFSSCNLGEALHHIHFHLEGSEDAMEVRVKANVVPPVLHFDVDQLDFGAISYSFSRTKDLQLVNASKIGVTFSLCIPEEANYRAKEFEITPSSGRLEPYGSLPITVTLTAFSVRTFDYRLVVNVMGVGSELISIPVKGTCQVPDVVIREPELDFDLCYLRYPHKQTFVIENTSANLQARYDVGEQDDHSRVIASYSTSETGGVISPKQSISIDVYLRCEKIGNIRLPLLINVAGSTDLPLALTLSAVGSGPKVEVDQSEIHWGNASCLVDHPRQLSLYNKSLIPAYFKTLIRNPRSKFQIDQKEGVVPPGESTTFTLIANLDDTILFKDQLHILIDEGDNIVVPLSIKGTGTTMWCPSELQTVDFGFQMTAIECEWSCTLENKGKRSQTITWINKSAEKAKMVAAAAARRGDDKAQKPRSKSNGNGRKRKAGGNQQEGEASISLTPVFSVFPGSVELKPRTACVFVFKGLSLHSGEMEEELVCETRVGKEKNSKVAFATKARGSFIIPKITPSSPLLRYEYTHVPGEEIFPQSQSLTLTNTCALPISFTLKTQAPFALDSWEAALEPNESMCLSVEFHPGHKNDQTCRILNGKVMVAYTNHPQKDTIDLVGDISFPNLSFEITKIDFGCVLNDTQKSIFVSATNVSRVDTTYRWVFIENEKEVGTKKAHIPVNRVFDILPTRGVLKPGESEKIEVVFFGHANRKFRNIVVCEVEGGPEYELVLSGEASSLVYKLDKHSLDFGSILFDKVEERDVTIQNTGKVALAFSISVEKLGCGRFIDIVPASGKMAPGEKQRIVVRLRPGIPEKFTETLIFEIAHFQPFEFMVFGNGTFSSVSTNLPREAHTACSVQGLQPVWKEMKARAKDRLIASLSSLSDNSVHKPIDSKVGGMGHNGADRNAVPPSVAGSPTKSMYRGTSQGSPKKGEVSLFDDVDVEMEACRRFFAEYLTAESANKQKPQETDNGGVRNKDRKVSKKESLASIKQMKMSKENLVETLPFLLSHFVLDFGSIVLGSHKVRKFSVTNLSRVPASFQLDKNLAAAGGFQIEPERVVRLPEKQSIEFTVTFQAKKTLPMGPRETQLPIIVKNGPPCVVTIRAIVTVPDVTLSVDTFDFGKMAVGTCHSMFTQLHNPSIVPAEWSIKKPMGSTKDLSFFHMSPLSGSLAPGDKVNVQIDFVPNESRSFSLKVPVKVVDNPKTRSIVCRGEGSELRISFDPPLLDFGPLLPCVECEERVTTIQNDSEYPVEIFSLDFDKEYELADQLLRDANGYNNDGLLHLPIRPPGKSMQDYLLENGLITLVDTNAMEGAGDLTEGGTREDSRSGVDYVVLGPPKCGVTTQAELLAQKEGLTLWSIDEAIKGACSSESVLGNELRIALGLAPDADKEENEDVTEGTDPMTNHGSDKIEMEKSVRDTHQSDAPATDMNTQKPSDKISSDVETNPFTPYLDRIIRWRLEQPDMRCGSVLDGFNSAYVPTEAVLKACQRILLSTRIIRLVMDDETYAALHGNLEMSVKYEPLEVPKSLVSPSVESIHSTVEEPANDVHVDDAEVEIDPSNQSAVESDEVDNDPHEASQEVPQETEVEESEPVEQETQKVEITQEDIDKYMESAARISSISIEEYRQMEATYKSQIMDVFYRSSQPIVNAENPSPTTSNQEDDSSNEANMTHDHFFLDIPILAAEPSLALHNAVWSAIDHFIHALENDKMTVPPAKKVQIFRRPMQRYTRKPTKYFSFKSSQPQELPVPDTTEETEVTGEPTDGDEGSVDEKPSEVVPSTPPIPTRWVLQPHESTEVIVQFAAQRPGSFDAALGFEIVGLQREFSLLCRGVSAVPMINSDCRNVFMHRVKHCPEGAFVKKKFVMSKNQFEFGPLILDNSISTPESKEEFESSVKLYPDNVETFRLSNLARAPLQVHLSFKENESSMFAIHPSTLVIGEGDTSNVLVWSNPTAEGLHTNALIVCVEDNPEPVVFDITCYGCLPSLELGGGLTPASSLMEEEALRPTSPKAGREPASTRNGKQEVATTPAESPVLDALSLDFGQLLLGRESDKHFDLQNTSALPVKWRIMTQDLPESFRLFPLEGVVKPMQKDTIVAMFSSLTEVKHKYELSIEYSDASSDLQNPDRVQTLSLFLEAEAYKVDVRSFHTSEEAKDQASASGRAHDGSLDFGLVRVGEAHVRSFPIENRGKYDVKYILSIRTVSSRKVFTIEPSETILGPNESAEINVTFQSDAEVVLRDCKDLRCSVMEMKSGEVCQDFIIFTSVRAVFSVLRVQPSRGVNFGPLKYSDQPKVKQIEIRNEGEFVFKYRLRPFSDEAEDALTLETELQPNTLTVGQFTISPDCGSIDPGVSATIDIAFTPLDCAIYRQIIQVEVSGQNPTSALGQELLHYELIGESCYPSINTNDYDSIFEEQIVVRSLAENSGMDTKQAENGLSQAMWHMVLFAETEKVFSFGAIIAVANTKGVMERFKISNPTKVPTTVDFQILPTPSGGSNDAGATKAQEMILQAFVIQPTTWEIPPLEYRYVNVYFRPSAILSYRALFSAQVAGGPDTLPTEDKLLSFEVRGEGTMPCVTVITPIERDAAGAIPLDFGNVRVSKTKTQSVVIRNDGLLPATVLFWMPKNANFIFAAGNSSMVLAPATSETLEIQFKPRRVHSEPSKSVLKISVQNNPFDETVVTLTGSGYNEDVVFEELPMDHIDELHFGHLVLPKTSEEEETPVEPTQTQQIFSISNTCSSTVRFEWSSPSPFTFSPALGHLPPHSSKAITATFITSEPIVCTDIAATLNTQTIEYPADEEQAADGWDDLSRVVSFDGDDSNTAEETTSPEPTYEAIGSPSSSTLKCFANADTPTFKCETTVVLFKQAFMLQVYTHTISIRNSSKIDLEFSWRWEAAYDALLVLDEDFPFDISPSSGTIHPDQEQSFVIKFAPVEVNETHCTLFFDILGSSDESLFHRIHVRGSSLRPACHFDLERSDYPQHRAPHLPGPTGEIGPLDSSIRIIEMESLGVRVKNTRRFYVVNPTNVSYEFSWTPEGEVNSSFRCVTPRGLMLGGKRCEMVFEFIPQQLSIQEMFYRFRIPHFQINQLFLVVGKTTEPRVMLDRGNLNFNSLLLGSKATQSLTLVNQEHLPFHFVFDKSSLDFAGEAPALLVHPLSGVVPPNGRCSIGIEFMPTEEKQYNFNVNCIVKRKPTRLSLNVKGEGYAVHDSLRILSTDREDSTDVVYGADNVLDFGVVPVNEMCVRSIEIQNGGKFNFDFSWNEARLPSALSIDPTQGTVKKTGTTICEVRFSPTAQTSLDGAQLICTIAGHRNYTFHLRGSGVPPSLHLSFSHHDFGSCFIAEPNANPITQTTALTIVNMDLEMSVDLDCTFENKPHLRVECPPTVLGPRDSVNVPITFIARQEAEYLEAVMFVVNGTTTMSVTIRGEGVVPKVDLVNSAMQNVAFGNVPVGQQVTRTIRLINRSKRTADIEVSGSPSASGLSVLDSIGVAVLPQHEVSLRPKETMDLEARFTPTERVPMFDESVFIRVAGSTKRLFTVSGSSQGMDVSLEADLISFGTVCLGSQLVRQVRMQNRGDLPAKYRWNSISFAPDFSISPADGTVMPNSHKTFDIVLKPQTVNPDIRYNNLLCTIDGQVSPLKISLTASCIEQDVQSIQEVRFDAKVREESTEKIILDNPSDMSWNLVPVVQGEYWRCVHSIAVPAKGSATLEVIYQPLRMTSQNESDDEAYNRPAEHVGSIFFAIPDGSARRYNLIGVARPPDTAGSLSMSTPAKKPLAIAIPVKNWLKSAQSFSVDIEKPPPEEGVVAQGPSVLTVQGSSQRNYVLKFQCYVEKQVALQVRFVNAETGEYVVCQVNVEVTQAMEVDTLSFDAPVRQSVKKIITIENPLPDTCDVNFANGENWWKCTHPTVRVSELRSMSRRPEGSYEVEFRPILYSADVQEAELTISFQELGDYTYKLLLKTQPASTDRTLTFSAPLGGRDTQTFTFTSYSSTADDLACSVSPNQFFSTPASCRVEGSTDWDGRESSVQIQFEPEALGEVHDTLTVRSDRVGEFKCALIGHATAPLPRGPFVFSGSHEVSFRNVYSSATNFVCSVDNPRFVLSAKSLSIPAKASKSVNVKYDRSITVEGQEKSGPTAGGDTCKLFISCPEKENTPTWIYYLQSPES